jgi:hypothetical protein
MLPSKKIKKKPISKNGDICNQNILLLLKRAYPLTDPSQSEFFFSTLDPNIDGTGQL